jgi:hypothetical protein
MRRAYLILLDVVGVAAVIGAFYWLATGSP